MENKFNKEGTIRINKFISQSGFCSRREAEKLIQSNQVRVNGNIASLGQGIAFNDVVEINGIRINLVNEKKYYLLNKPKKTICSLKDNFNRRLVIDLIDDQSYLFPVGRLDYNTTGAIIITNDGELANRLIHPSYNIERIYRARINRKLTNKELEFLNSEDVLIDGKKSIQKVEYISSKSYLIYLNQGFYHHVKKLFEHVDCNVIDLKRISFAGLTCEKMIQGSYRKLKPFEIKGLKKLVKIN